MVEKGGQGVTSYVFDTFTFSICHTIVFVLYWFVICPLVFLNLCNFLPQRFGNSHLWPVVYWICALLFFIILLLFILHFWKLEVKQVAIRPYKETDKLLCEHNKYDCPYCNEEPSEDKNDTTNLEIRSNVNKTRYEKHRHTEQPKSRKPDLKLKIRPTSQMESYELTITTPRTPRELFFMDLIQAANESPSAQIPQAQLFLYNERKYSDAIDRHRDRLSVINEKPESPKLEKPSENAEVKETEVFVANVPKVVNESNVVFLYIPNSESAESVTLSDDANDPVSINDDVFVDCP